MFSFFVAASAQTLTYGVECAHQPSDIVVDFISGSARWLRGSTYQLVALGVIVVVLCIAWRWETFNVEYAAGLSNQTLSFGVCVPAVRR